MNRATGLEITAISVTVLAVYLSVSTMDYQDVIEKENADLKSQVKKLKKQVADPPKFCREYLLQQMRKRKP
mgnify:CR=1 FL=1